MAAPGLGHLRFLYVGVEDTDAAVVAYTGVLAATLRWRFQRFGADVAGVEVGDDTLVLLADHRPTGSVLPIWVVDDLAAVADRLAAGGLAVAGPEPTPEGSVIVATMPGAADLAFMQVERPDALDGAFDDVENPYRVTGVADR